MVNFIFLKNWIVIKAYKNILIVVSFLFTAFFNAAVAMAQEYNCNFKDPVITIDFGTLDNKKDIDLSSLKNYGISKKICPNDGQYCFAAFTNDCFSGKWHSIMADHTADDDNGRMMIVNASERPSAFFINDIAGFTAGKTYEVSFWLINICRYAEGCSPTPPNIKTSLLSANSEIVHFQTGALEQTTQPNWRKFYGEFTMPANTSAIILKMEDVTNGGCGNDFALDDIIFKECKIKEPPIVVAPKPVEKIIPKIEAAKKPVELASSKPSIKPLVVKPNVAVEKPKTAIKTIAPAIVKTSTKQIPTIIPKPIATRENALIRKIETDGAEMIIELYDNGDIDGDTVTIYHNNQLIVNHAGLSAKPITIKIKVDKANPHHELIMVADNLGSIPPNTSLMIITANKKRYEVYISSSEQKNAKIVIDLK
jgi:hypothetical protein